MTKENLEKENARLKEELKQVKKENRTLSGKLTSAKKKKADLQKKVKKKGALTIEVSKEQLESLSNPFEDINIQSLLLD